MANTTLADLQVLARDIANVDSNRLGDTILTQYLNAAQLEIMQTTRVRFGEALVTTAFSDGIQTINPAPSSGVILYPTKMWFTDPANGSKADVDEVSWDEYVARWGTASSSGAPYQFAIYGQSDLGHPTFYLGPIPSSDISPVYVSARIRMADLSASTDHNQLTDQAPLAVVYRALMFACPYLENSERLTEWSEEYKNFKRLLVLSHGGARYSAKTERSMQEPG